VISISRYPKGKSATAWVISFLIRSDPSVLTIGAPGNPGDLGVALIGLVPLIAANLMALAAARQMTRGRDGYRLLIQSLALTVVFSLVFNIGRASPGGFLVQLALRLVLYYLALISRSLREPA
jgi:hypothetical protein